MSQQTIGLKPCLRPMSSEMPHLPKCGTSQAPPKATFPSRRERQKRSGRSARYQTRLDDQRARAPQHDAEVGQESQSHHCVVPKVGRFRSTIVERAPAMQKLAWRVELMDGDEETIESGASARQHRTAVCRFTRSSVRQISCSALIDDLDVSASYQLPLRLPFRRWLTTPPARMISI